MRRKIGIALTAALFLASAGTMTFAAGGGGAGGAGGAGAGAGGAGAATGGAGGSGVGSTDRPLRVAWAPSLE